MTETESNEEEENTRISVVVAKTKKEEWESYVDESPEYGTLSGLIRRSVEKEISDGHEAEAPTGGVEMQAKLSDKLDEVINSLNSLNARVDRIESESRKDPVIQKLTNEVYDYLPDVEPGTREWEEEREDLQTQAQHESADEEIQAKAHGWNGTIEGLAEALDEPPIQVEQALEKLMEETHGLVQKTEYGGSIRYYRTG